MLNILKIKGKFYFKYRIICKRKIYIYIYLKYKLKCAAHVAI